MGQDRSLDEFVGGKSPESTASDTDSVPAEDDSADPEIATDDSDTGTGAEPTSNGGESDADESSDHTTTTPDDVEPATITYRWEPDGVQCPECGATVDQLWSGESGQVCAACKEW